MSVNGSYKQRAFATLSAFAFLCAFASCATSNPDSAKTADAPLSDASLLDDSTKFGATDVPDSSAFSDLNKTESSAADKSAPPADGDAFYNTVGGETLSRVAFTLYSDRGFAKQLLDRNPDLKGAKKLGAAQRVFFDMDSAKPEPRYLTKDLLDRYAAPLAEKLETAEKSLSKTTATLNKGESLQDLSQRLYGTHRYWTEIYLVNRDKIQNYDKVTAGLTLTVVSRPNLGMAKAEAPAALAKLEEPRKELPPPPAAKPAPKAEKPVPVVAPSAAVIPPPTQPEPVAIQKAEPVKVLPKDPIPEIPPVAEKAAPLEVKPLPEPTPSPPAKTEPVKLAPIAEAPKIAAAASDAGSSNSSLRRILYLVLILAIGGTAFYFTRTPKRPKLDMLDVNAGATERLKLTPKDSQKSSIG